MAKEQNKNTVSDLPQYIKDLLVETPSAITKLCALWDGLTVETQLKVLSEIKAGRYSCYFTDKIYVKAVKSQNPYVRYLAAKDLSFGEYTSDEVNAVEKLIKEDTDPLVKYSLYEYHCLFPPSAMKNNPLYPEAFFKLPHQARLAIVRAMSGYGKEVAAVIRYAIDNLLENKAVTEQELFDIILDYAGRDFREQGYFESRFDAKGNVIYIERDDIEALWKLVPDIPISCAHILVAKLPGGSMISEEVASKITDSENSEWLLEPLLYRDDISLGNFRGSFFLKYIESGMKNEPDTVQNAAILHNFDLTYEGFEKVLGMPEESKLNILLWLAEHSNDMSLCLYDAMHDILSLSGYSNKAYAAIEKLEERIAKLCDKKSKMRITERLEEKENQILQFRLYRLAKLVVPWDSEDNSQLPEALGFLQEYIVEGKTWKTFTSFADAWSKQPDAWRLREHLPEVHELYEVESDSSEDKNISYENMEIRFALKLSSLESEIGRIKILIYFVIALIIGLLISK